MPRTTHAQLTHRDFLRIVSDLRDEYPNQPLSLALAPFQHTRGVLIFNLLVGTDKTRYTVTLPIGEEWAAAGEFPL